MKQNGCTLYCIVVILATVTYAMGAPFPDALDLNSRDEFAPSYFESKRYVDSRDPALLGMRGDELPAPFKRESYHQIDDQNQLNMYKRRSKFEELVQRLNRLRGNHNKNRTPRTTMLRFGTGGKRK